MRRTDRSLVRRPVAWLVMVAVVALGQAIMWRGWYASGEWATPDPGGLILSAAVVAVPSLLVGAGALALLTRRLTVAVFVVAYLGVATWVASFLSTSGSSTAVFAFAAPPIYSAPVLLVLALIDLGLDRMRGLKARGS